MIQTATLPELLPAFAAELYAALSAGGEHLLASQVPNLTVQACTYDGDCEAGYIYVQAAEALNVVEQNIIGVHHGKTVAVVHSCDVYVDVDNFGRITGIKLLEPSACAGVLLAFGDHRRAEPPA